MGTTVFKRPPTSAQVTAFLRQTIRKARRATPRYIISDKGPQFWCEGFSAHQGTLARRTPDATEPGLASPLPPSPASSLQGTTRSMACGRRLP